MLYSYSIIIFFVVILGLCVFVRLSSRQHPARRAFLLFLASMLLWNASLAGGSFATQISADPRWYWLVLTAAVLLHGMALLGFCVQFPTRASGSHWRRWSFALLVAGTIWLPIVWVIARSGISTFAAYGIVKFFSYGTQYWILCCLVVCIVYLGSYLHTICGQERLQVGYLLTGLGCVLCGHLWIVFLHPDDMMSLITSQSILFALIFSILATYALFWSPLIGMNSLIQSTTVNVITFVVISLLLSLLLYTFNRVFVTFFILPFRLLDIIGVIAFGMVFQPCRYSVKRIWKRCFKSSALQRTDILLQQAIQTCQTITEPRVLIGILTQAVQKTMQTRSLAILRPTEAGRWEKMSSLHQQDQIPDYLANDDLLIRFYQQHTAPEFSDILVQQQGESLELGLQLQAWGCSLVQPTTTDGKVTGLVLLGEKESGAAYTAEDLYFLQELSLQVVHAMDRTHQYEDLRLSADALQAQIAERQKDECEL